MVRVGLDEAGVTVAELVCGVFIVFCGVELVRYDPP